MSETALTRGTDHVGLTVPSLADALSFFTEVLGFDKVGEKPDYPAAFVSDGEIMITLWQVADPSACAPFDRKAVLGLHHLAFKVEDSAALDRVYQAVKAAEGVEIEFAPEPLGTSSLRHMMCAMPGGLRLEFIGPAK